MRQIKAILLTLLIVFLTAVIPYYCGVFINYYFDLESKFNWVIGAFSLFLILIITIGIIAIYNQILENIK